MTEKGLKRGQPITFRIPSDTSDHILKQLQRLKEVERRNFSSKVAEFVLEGVSDSLIKQREAITIPLPKGLSKAQRDWLKHEHSEALLGSIVYQLLSDPIRTAALFTSLNSNALDVDEALYLQEEVSTGIEAEADLQTVDIEQESNHPPIEMNDLDDDLDQFDWEALKGAQSSVMIEEEEEMEEDPLGDFLAQMNK
ncbi:hypothetical protein [Bacillus sp. FJAT-50079]|uniref:hypothetical protein n=1 Tax=Bacillus sp. FJAT-50079 TaxID=2833577 RepID=UPI001BC98A06|nr:hypothetical protein [Bacillus sp. FJAT-50079]MBS4206998.1 hypothetical protein [Bacillus sp. FJAT-50079]